MIWRSRVPCPCSVSQPPASTYSVKKQGWWNWMASRWIDGTKPFLYVVQIFSLYLHWVLAFAIGCYTDLYLSMCCLYPVLKSQMSFLLMLLGSSIVSFISGDISMSFEDHVTELIQTWRLPLPSFTNSKCLSVLEHLEAEALLPFPMNTPTSACTGITKQVSFVILLLDCGPKRSIFIWMFSPLLFYCWLLHSEFNQTEPLPLKKQGL